MRKSLFRLFSLSFVTVWIGGQFLSVASAAVTRESPTSVEQFRNQDGDSVSVSTYADGSKTYYNKDTGVFSGDADWQTLTPQGGSSAPASTDGSAPTANSATDGQNTATANAETPSRMSTVASPEKTAAAVAAWQAPAAGGSSSTTIKVTEYIPGLTDTEGCKQGAGKFKDQTCSVTIQGGFSSVQKMISGFVKYVTFLAVLGTVLMLVISGIQYSLAGVTDGKADAKEKIAKTLKAFAVLFLVGFILNTVAPWVYR